MSQPDPDPRSSAGSGPARGISVVLPAHDEEAVIEAVAVRCGAALARLALDFEIIIVDDGSRDRTGELADAIAARDPRVRAVHNVTNLGYGGALRAGFAAARRPLVVFIDADGQFDLADLERLLPLAEAGNAAVVGYRARRRDPLLRRLNAWGWNRVVRLVLRVRVRDVDCAFKLFETELIQRLDIRSSGAMINAEMLAKLARLGISPPQVPVTHYPRVSGRSSGANPGVILRAFVELWRLRASLLRWQPSSVSPPDASGVELVGRSALPAPAWATTGRVATHAKRP